MHTPTFKHVHVPPGFLHFVEQHLITSILVALIILGSIFYLSSWISTPVRVQEISAPSTPLILLNSPAHAHEFPVRTHYIKQQLDQLLLDTRADRAYAFAYSDSTAHRGPKDVTIAHVFETVKPGIAPKMTEYQGFSRMDWLRVQTMQQSTDGLTQFFPNGYSIELYDRTQHAIGYVGFEFTGAHPQLVGNEWLKLQQAAAGIEDGILRPLEELQGQ